ATAPIMWRAASEMPRTTGFPTVVVVGHPYCPCTRATIGELALLMTRLHGKATAVVSFIHPDGTPEHWEETDLWRSAAAIPGVTVVSDQSDREADLFTPKPRAKHFCMTPTVVCDSTAESPLHVDTQETTSDAVR